MTLSELTALNGRTALVAGGGGGIGAAIVARFCEAGAVVVSVDRVVSDSPRGVRVETCDVTSAAGVSELFRRLAADGLDPDILVHSVGITRDRVVWKLTDADWRAVLAANLDSAFHLLREAIPRMRVRGGGAIVLIASINGERGKIGQANYAASKAGMIGLARTVAREVGRYGIRVNVIAPGLVRTPMTRNLPREVLDAAKAEAALGQTCDPEDIANAALYLCCQLSRRVTGQVLRVDGGQLIR
jgi:acetoacetyl-CoA reductase/3-oxoacyl-[acyl-carrier protein] reductase